MESIWTMDVSIPLSQVMLVVAFGTLALVFGRLKLALLAFYGFLLYYGRWWDIRFFGDLSSRLDPLALLITGLCILSVLLAMVGLVFHRD